MGTVIDYVKWRGDLRFSQDPFNEVDALILAVLSYLPFNGIVAGIESRKRISLEQTAREYFEQNPSHEKDPSSANLTVSSSMDADLMELFIIASRSRRFSGILLSGYEDKKEKTTEQQFAAVTFHLANSNPKKIITFRGTDNTLIGWKEDFKISYKEKIPAQESARKYLAQSIGLFSGKVTVCGHSKGGNLAVYAAAYLNRLKQGRVQQVLNFDGPGFNFSNTTRSNFAKCESKVGNYIPEESIVGVLFEAVGSQSVIKSSARYTYQHNPLTWQVEKTKFTQGELSETTKLLKENLESWLDGLAMEKRKAFIDALFEILGVSENDTVDIKESLKDINKVIKNYTNLDDDIKKLISEVLSSMTDQAKNAISKTLKEKIPGLK